MYFNCETVILKWTYWINIVSIKILLLLSLGYLSPTPSKASGRSINDPPRARQTISTLHTLRYRHQAFITFHTTQRGAPNLHHPPNTWPSYEDLDLQFLVTKSTSHHQSQSNHFKKNQNLAKSIRELEIDSDSNWKQLHMFTPSVKLLFMSYFMLTNKFRRSSMFSFWWIAAINQYIHSCPPCYVC